MAQPYLQRMRVFTTLSAHMQVEQFGPNLNPRGGSARSLAEAIQLL